jgi:hypothetical protein
MTPNGAGAPGRIVPENDQLTLSSGQPAYPLGARANWRGQSYELTAIKPYRRRRDGRETLLLVWCTLCLECGAWFEVTTPNRKLTYPNRRCALHKSPGRRSAEPATSNKDDAL